MEIYPGERLNFSSLYHQVLQAFLPFLHIAMFETRKGTCQVIINVSNFEIIVKIAAITRAHMYAHCARSNDTGIFLMKQVFFKTWR